MSEHSPQVEYMIANLKKLEALRHQIALDHGFAYKRPQHFKECVVIRFKNRWNKDKAWIDYPRIEEYVAFAHGLCDKYELRDEKHVLLESDLMLAKIGIYCFHEWHQRTWAIPNTNKAIQKYVLSKLPKWAKVSVKK